MFFILSIFFYFCQHFDLFFPPLFSHPEEASIADKSEIGLTEIEEGEEPDVFWMALGGHDDYGSLLNGKSTFLS